jgi:uncharacterized membrane protein YbaN (DUF454 family)
MKIWISARNQAYHRFSPLVTPPIITYNGIYLKLLERRVVMRLIYFFIAVVSLLLGILGAFLPVLPTVPFLLVTTFCFSKSSPTLHASISKTTFYKKHVQSYALEKKMTMKSKLSILIPATIMMLLGALLSPGWHLRIFLLVLCAIKYVYFFAYIKTIKED